ncbi:MAG: cytochrome c3 family protein [Thermodesulfovibrionales bacterium]
MYRLLFAVVCMLILIPAPLFSKPPGEKSHFNKENVPKGCASCHKGHGKYNTPMLPEVKRSFCFSCHGDITSIEKTQSKGNLSGKIVMDNIEKEFEKPYRHPVEKTGIHSYNEILPEKDPSMPRHVVCGDCHHHHFVTHENKFSGLKGTDRSGLNAIVQSEFELCFNCHSYSANLPANQTNKADLFNITNPSYHPVIAQGKNLDVPSLVPPFSASSTIKCSDCHGNDDPAGPKGLHGSSYNHILSKHFSDIDGPEDLFQYELCYNCHRRSSILHNESFPYHDLHISTEGVSCRTCHNPHGSTRFPHLIDFYSSAFIIRPSKSGRIDFIKLGIGAGKCYLNCHDKDHDPATYPAEVKKSPSPSTKNPSRR